jgi:hypothetical protein
MIATAVDVGALGLDHDAGGVWLRYDYDEVTRSLSRADLLVERELFIAYGQHGPAIATLALLAPLCIVPTWFLPEPAQKKLEEIAAERK